MKKVSDVMKKLILGVFCICMLVGCGSKDAYERNEGAGKIVTITLDEMQEKLSNKETFPIVFTTSYCGYCSEFHEVFEEYIKTHHVVMYEVVLDMEDRSEQENLDIILPHFPQFYSTPGVFFVKDGKNEEYLDFASLGMNEEVIDEWVQKHQLDRKK